MSREARYRKWRNDTIPRDPLMNYCTTNMKLVLLVMALAPPVVALTVTV
jgi:hypothetical protein